MKQNLAAFLVGTIIFSGVGVSSAVAQVLNREDAIDWISNVPFNIITATESHTSSTAVGSGLVDSEGAPAAETRHLQAEFRGTNLAPEQLQIRQQNLEQSAQHHFPDN